MPVTIEPIMGLADTTDDTPYDFQGQVEANWTRLKNHDHSLGYGVPVKRADGLVVTNGLQVSTGDIFVAAGRYQDVTTGHSFGYDTPTTRFTLTDTLAVTGQVVASQGVIASGAASSFAGGVALFPAGIDVDGVLLVPIGTVFPTVPAPAAGQLFYKSDELIMYAYDGTAWSPLAPAVSIVRGAAYPGAGTFAPGVTHIFCTAAIAITLPNPTGATATNRPPITIAAVTGNSTVAASGGSTVIGGSFNTTTGAVINGQVNQGDAISYKSDGTNWRAV